MTRPFREARVDLDAVRSNIALLRQKTAPAQMMAVVKANAYGHGAVEVARAVTDAGAEWLGVADLGEARALRSAGIEAPLLAWLHGTDADFEGAVAAGVDLGLSTAGQLERAAATSGTAFVQLKFDTGLSRNGFDDAQCAQIIERAAEHERAGRIRVRGVFSHLANAGAEEDLAQLARFRAVLDQVEAAGLTPELRHLAATAGALSIPDARFTLVRVGLGVYGLSPFDDEDAASLGLTPAMELSAEIAAIRRVPAGTGVSYDYAYRTEAESTLALVPLGYADGIPRRASSAGPVSINGKRYRVSGRVAMDQFMVDLGQDTAEVGDRVVLFGNPADGVPSAADWATASETINYEVVTRIGSRVTRSYTP